ncbi:MAG: response regulator transcription factor [Actinomycetota bacterium]|nr:response regulator transcription factor [Actinomycetota bacterium]
MQAVLKDVSGDQASLQPAGIKILLADDHPLIIAGIRRTIEHVDDMEVVGEAHSGEELLQLIDRRAPDIILMDFKMPGVHGVEIIERIRTGWPEVKTVILSACDDRPIIDAALHAGASAYVLKSAHTIDIASVLRQASSGAVFHAPASAPPRSGAPQVPSLPTLTDRERSILSAVASGMTTAAISGDLWISEHTIKFHLTNIYRKLGVANRAGAVRYALENGIV